MPNTDHEQIAAERGAIAGGVALTLGWSREDAEKARDRAIREYRSGVIEGTAGFAGTLSMGTARDGSATLSIRTYTGKIVDPRATGQAGCSTDD